MMFPPITIVITTYFPDGDVGDKRRNVARRTLFSWDEYLRYRGHISLHISDDGSKEPLKAFWEPESRSQQDHQGVGSSLNKGFAKAFEISPLVFFSADDWALTQEFDLTPWAYLLLQREDVGIVNLGPPYPNVRGTVEILSDNYQGWGLRLEKINLACGLRPSLYHKRFIDHYGWFTENVNALECERLLNEHFCATPGPDIVLALPHPWQHLGDTSLSGLEPRK